MSDTLDRNQSSSQTNSHELFDTENLKHDLKKRSIRGGVTTIIAQGFKFFITLVSNVWLARLLTPNDYGLVGMVMVVTGFISQFKTLGLSMATVQKDEINHQQISTLFWINVGISVFITCVTIALAPFISSVYSEPRLTYITIVLAIGISISGLGIQHAALLKRHMRYQQLAINEVLSLSIGLGSAVWAAWSGLGYWALVIYPVATATVSTLGYWLGSRWIPGRPRWGAGVGSMLSFGGNLAGFTMINYCSRNVDNFLIGKVWGAYELGLYAKAYQLFTLPLKQIITPLTSVTVPLLSRLVSSPEKFRTTYIKILEKVLFLTMPLVIFMIISADWLIYFLLGPNWVEIVPLFRWLGLAGIFQPISSSIGWVFISQGKTDKMFKCSLVGATITILSFIIGLSWGALGVAISYSLAMSFISIPLLFWYTGKNTPVKNSDFYMGILPILASSLLAGGALLSFRYLYSAQYSLMLTIYSLLIFISSFLISMLVPNRGRRVIFEIVNMLSVLKNK